MKDAEIWRYPVKSMSGEKLALARKLAATGVREIVAGHAGLKEQCDFMRMVKDGYGTLWIATQLGLHRFNPATEEFRVYKPGGPDAPSDVFITTTGFPPSAARTPATLSPTNRIAPTIAALIEIDLCAIAAQIDNVGRARTVNIRQANSLLIELIRRVEPGRDALARARAAVGDRRGRRGDQPLARHARPGDGRRPALAGRRCVPQVAARGRRSE